MRTCPRQNVIILAEKIVSLAAGRGRLHLSLYKKLPHSLTARQYHPVFYFVLVSVHFIGQIRLALVLSMRQFWKVAEGSK